MTVRQLQVAAEPCHFVSSNRSQQRPQQNTVKLLRAMGPAARSPSSKAVTRSRQIAVILSGNRQSIKVAATALRFPLVRCGGLPRQLYRIVRLCAGGKFRRSSPDPDYSQACETVLSAFLPTEVGTSVNLSFGSVPTIGSFRAWLIDDRPIGLHVSSFPN